VNEPAAKKRDPVIADPREKNRVGVRDVRNVIVLVTGTTAPTNVGTDPRSQSHSVPGEVSGDGRYWGEYADLEDRLPGSAEDALDKFNFARDDAWYWQDNRGFRQALVELCKQYSNLHLFRVHGWSGDNAADNRRVAGAYLANRLRGAGGEKAYYKGWLDKPVAFHLIGHSHGGNVINEFTRRAAEMGNWPKLWKIRSITYLSTPFFTTLHPVNTKVFDPECKVLNVHCQYDLTQRVVADFSLLPLFLVAQHGSVERVGVAVKAVDFDKERLSSLVSVAIGDLTVTPESDPVEILKKVFTGNLSDLARVTFGAGPLYRELERLLAAAAHVIDEVRAVLTQLREPLWFPVAHNMKDKVSNRRVVLSAGLHRRFDQELARIRTGLLRAETRLRVKREAHPHPDGIQLSEMADDIDAVGDVVDPLARFVEIDETKLSGPLIDLVGDIALEQLEHFDNTRRSPDKQLEGTPFASRIVDIDVTMHDDYSEKPDQNKRHPRFVQLIEAAERQYEQSRQKRDLINLLLTLGAQHEMARWWGNVYGDHQDMAPWLGRGTALAAALEDLLDSEHNRLFRAADRLFNAGLAWAKVLHARDVGGLEVPNSKSDTQPAIGSLDHLMRVSHSVSRQELYPPVRDALTKQFSTRLRRRRR
jgi:hypothetical protein